MQTIESLKRKIKSAEDLLSVVQTMKALAAVSIRQYERAVESLLAYNRTIEMGLHIVLRTQEELTVLAETESSQRLGVIVFGTDQGLCGQFNERIVSYSIDQINGRHIKREDRSILVIGERTAALLDEAGQPIESLFPVPNSISGVTPLVQDLLLKVDDWRTRHTVDQILLFHHQPLTSSLYQPHTVQLLPLDVAWLQSLKQTAWPSRVLPTFTMKPDRLFSTLIRQHLFVLLYRACVESLAGENASRLVSMQNAEANIEELLDDLNLCFHHQRQHSITAELLDIVAGFEAVTGA